jgi:hypothetical protein
MHSQVTKLVQMGYDTAPAGVVSEDAIYWLPSEYQTITSLLQTTMKEIKDWVQNKVQIRRGMNNKDQSMILHQLRFELGGNYKQLQLELMVVKENLNKIQFGTKTKN